MPITPKIRDEIEAQPTPNWIFTTGIDGEVSGVFNYDTLDNLDQYRIGDIVGSLCRMRRYAGFGNQPYSIGAHSLLVLALANQHCDLDTRQGLSLLAHDFSEAYVNDLCSPFKRKLIDYQSVENKCMQALQTKLKCDFLESDLIRRFDIHAFKHEVIMLFNMSEKDVEFSLPKTKEHQLTPLGYRAAEYAYSFDQSKESEGTLAKALLGKLDSLGVTV